MLALLAALLLQQAPPPAPPTPPRPAPPRAAPARPETAEAPPTSAARSGLLRGTWPAAPSGKTVTLDDTVSRDDALETIAGAAGWNVVLNTGRLGNALLVLKLRAVPVEDALQFALEGTDLVATRRGDSVVIAPAGAPVARAPQDVLSGFDRPTGRSVTLDLSDADAGEALRKIADAGGISIVLPPGPLAKVSAHFRNAPVEEALRAVLEQAGLVAAKRGSVVAVSPGGPGRRHAEADSAEAERDAREAERDEREAERDRRSGARTSRDRVVQGDVTIQAGETVRDVVAIRGNIVLRPGAEARDLVAVVGKVTLESGARTRQAVAILGDVVVGPGAEIERDAVAVGGSVRPDPGAEIGGEQTSVGVPQLSGIGALAALPFGHGGGAWFHVATSIVKFIVYFLVGLLVVTVFPRRVEGVSAAMTARPAKAVLVGLLGFVLAGLLCLLLLVTLVGALLIPVVVVAVLAAGVLGFVALSFHVGRLLPIRSERRLAVLQLAAGTALLVLATHLPLLGWLVWITAALLTFGAVLVSRFGQQEPPVLPTTAVPPSGPAPA
ncbi:MAG TPA: STN domain-containing protein [Anaeromyxobacteraceae bacterium]|nr:STN domain-containing protein [Anaeromyxobacteraceae bacterium]